MSEQSDLREVETAKLILDGDNPRFFHLIHRGGKQLSQSDIEKEIIENDDDIPLLTRTVQKNGVKDPIWVIRQDDGRYLVLEGNRRTVVLLRLLKDKVQPPPGVRYDRVHAHIMPSNTPPVELVLQKARLQSGKKAWGAFNEAALTYQLQQPPHLMAVEDIAVDLKIPISKVRERIDNYKLFKEYVEVTSDDNPRRFAYFSECPSKVREWCQDSEKNKKSFFQLINPTGGKNKIRSVATRGGLRDFAQVLESPEAVKLLLEDATATVEDALDLAKESNIQKAIPLITRIAPLAQNLRSLEPAQIERLKAEVRFKVALRTLQDACKEVLEKIQQ